MGVLGGGGVTADGGGVVCVHGALRCVCGRWHIACGVVWCRNKCCMYALMMLRWFVRACASRAAGSYGVLHGCNDVDDACSVAVRVRDVAVCVQ